MNESIELTKTGQFIYYILDFSDTFFLESFNNLKYWFFQFDFAEHSFFMLKLIISFSIHFEFEFLIRDRKMCYEMSML